LGGSPHPKSAIKGRELEEKKEEEGREEKGREGKESNSGHGPAADICSISGA